MPSGRLKKGVPPPGRTPTISTRLTKEAGKILRREAAKENGLSGIKYASAAIIEKAMRDAVKKVLDRKRETPSPTPK